MRRRRLFDRFEHFVLDLDGVVYLRDQPISSAVEFIEAVRAEGKGVLFLTNNSMYGIGSYLRKLVSMGVKVRRNEIVTSATVLREHLEAKSEIKGSTVMVIGGKALKREMEKASLIPLKSREGRNARVVVVGWDISLTYEKLKNACLAIHNGADFYATNDDATYPAPDGKWPGAGSIVAALQRATGRNPIIVGKPHPPMMRAALKRLDCPPSRVLMIGDRLETDIAGGRKAGMATCLVLTGVSERRDIEKSGIYPDLVVDKLTDLLEER